MAGGGAGCGLGFGFALATFFGVGVSATGFCGGFSTFSTFSHENFLLLREGQHLLVAANITISVVAGIALFYLIARSA